MKMFLYVLISIFIFELITINCAPPSHIASSASRNPLWKSWSSSLPPSLAQLLIQEAHVFSDYEAIQDNLRDSKRRTRWFPIHGYRHKSDLAAF